MVYFADHLTAKQLTAMCLSGRTVCGNWYRNEDNNQRYCVYHNKIKQFHLHMKKTRLVKIDLHFTRSKDRDSIANKQQAITENSSQ